jgi:hypothetical protein
MFYNISFALQLRKKHEKTSVRVVEKCPNIPVAVVQYTFTHKQYTEQHNRQNTQNRTYITIRKTNVELVSILLLPFLLFALVAALSQCLRSESPYLLINFIPRDIWIG